MRTATEHSLFFGVPSLIRLTSVSMNTINLESTTKLVHHFHPRGSRVLEILAFEEAENCSFHTIVGSNSSEQSLGLMTSAPKFPPFSDMYGSSKRNKLIVEEVNSPGRLRQSSRVRKPNLFPSLSMLAPSAFLSSFVDSATIKSIVSSMS
uniref:Uncharacterized protein n=1 Tax=Solanum lycopersicum TaxID=4081 RepID=A0A3Q7JE68_SOLLC